MSENNTPQKGNDSIQEMLQRLLRSVSDLSGMPEELKSKDPRANDTAADRRRGKRCVPGGRYRNNGNVGSARCVGRK